MSNESKQSKGGKARAKKLTKDQRSEIARAASGARWGLPIATHEGTLRIAKLEIPCAVLEDGTRIIIECPELLSLALQEGGAASPGAAERLETQLQRHTPGTLSLLKFRTRTRSGSKGLRAELLPKLCEVWLDARKEGALMPEEAPIADVAETLIRGFSQLGIIALVDQATGFQHDRQRDALTRQLEPLVAPGLSLCARELPAEYFSELSRLRGVPFQPETGLPGDFGELTVDIVFLRLSPRALAELKDSLVRNETRKLLATGGSSGHPELLQHLGLATGLMRISPDFATFKKHLDAVAPIKAAPENLRD